jgi:hypothetical protein
MDAFKTFFVSNWKTSLAGFVALVCASDQLLQILPATVSQYLFASCGFAVAVGLIAAKDGDKSNAPVPSVSAVRVD